MRKITTLVPVIFVWMLSGTANADSDLLKLCAINGYASGIGDQLIESLSLKLREKYMVIKLNDRNCSAVYRDAREAAARFARSGDIRPNDMETILQYSEFRGRIESAILKSAGY